MTFTPRILYEDNHIIAVFKPAGLLVQSASPVGGGDERAGENLLDLMKEFIKKCDAKPGNVFLGLVHRLDRPVSGIVLFAKTSKGAARLSEQFRTRAVQKKYHALVHGKVASPCGVLIHRLVKDETQKIARVANEGSEANLAYTVIARNNEYSLLEIKLETGRFHQIRAQLSAIGHPIVGDIKYGAPQPLSDRSIALCATSVSFTTATGGKQKTLSVPYPKTWDALLGK